MSISRQLVSIGVPVYNEERYLRSTLNSLLSQDHENLELIISDNASTDGTAAICQEYARQDSRVRYYRNEDNTGAVANFNRAFELSNGDYFMWAGAHDLWHSKFVSSALPLFEADSGLVLVYPRTMLIDPDGNELMMTPDELDTRGLPALQRYLKLVWTIHWCNMIHGLIRSSVVRSTSGFQNVWGSDILLLVELSLIGEFAQLPEVLFYRRENRQEANQNNLDGWKQRYLMTLEGSYNARKTEASLQELFRELRNASLKVVSNSSLTYVQKMRVYVETMVCFRMRYGVPCPADPIIRLVLTSRRTASLCKRLYSKIVQDTA